jgi:RHS repeat-associated protein
MTESITANPGLRVSIFAAGLVLLASFCGASQISVVTTTVYVGRHFEVRDHEQPTKYIFNGSARVAEVSGSLRPGVRVQRLRLFPGWNLVSLAVSVDDLMGQLQASRAGILYAYQWNPATAGYSAITPGEAVAAGSVFWIKVSSNALFGVAGSYSDPTALHANAGGAYLPGPGLEAWTPVLPAAASDWTYDSQFDEWHQQLDAISGLAMVNPTVLRPGEPIYFQSSDPADLQIPDPSLRIRYYHQDHLGSSSVITDANGVLLEETAFYPFGIPRNNSEPRQVPDPYHFTQKEKDRESGLHYFEARYLAGSLARFVSVDTKYACTDGLSSRDLVSFLSNPQEINLYSYVRNNPLNFVDPTGLDGNSPSSQQARPVVLVVYGHDMYEDFQQRTGVSRAAYEKALQGAYEPERLKAGKDAQIVVKYVQTKKELEHTIKGSAYAGMVFNTHAYLNLKGGGLILSATDENHVEDIKAEDLQAMIGTAKTAPKTMYFYGCNTAKTGFAGEVSKRLEGTEVTGSSNEIAQDYARSARRGNFSLQENRDYNVTYSGGQEISNARKVDANNWSLPR